ncbi:MAG: cob(I)yrinic acid a,c-diamide adenosyltransferase [Chloroflexi bacterium]|nr:cob(I)yrinic acid a,c-diamide adenosyltransferase [Chloroflexota bacterium]
MARPPRKSPLYTRAGDRGETSLFGGKRLAKTHPRVEAYGSVDELNSTLGVAASLLRQRRLVRVIQSIQNELFDVGAELASAQEVKGTAAQAFRLEPDRVAALERLIDEYDAKVPPLKTFILPSGPPAAAHLHLARTVCRRAERAVVRLKETEGVNPNVPAYLNRLSDLLFALARYVSKAERHKELPWRKD